MTLVRIRAHNSTSVSRGSKANAKTKPISNRQYWLARKSEIVAPEGWQFWALIDTEAASSFLRFTAIQSVERV